jgi:tRNA A-37 threonylcarbamoyl transferase component Bud32
MNVYVNDNKFVLDSKNAISGGEGTVYLLNDKAFKIYHEKSKMIPIGKFRELNKIKNKNVIKPQELIYDEYKNIIGYTMKSIYNTVPLSRLITTDYQKNNNISHSDLITVISNIKNIIDSIHKDKCMVVDINDSNILVNHKLEVFFIDVDSYKTENYPATALQDFAKDFNVKDYKFTELSDWFSFGLLSTKILLGIHPYMGRWHKYKKREKENTLEYRSINNISIFNKDVVFPKTVRSFSFIPKNYYIWFLDIFEKGKRIKPPEKLGDFFNSVDDLILDIQSHISFKKVLDNKYKINNIFEGFRNQVILSDNNIYFQNKYIQLKGNYNSIMFNNNDEPMIFKINKNKQIESFNISTNKIKIYEQIIADNIYVFNNVIYAINKDNFMSLNLINLNEGFLTIKSSFSIMPYASQIFNNCIHQNIMNKSFFYLIHDKNTIPLIKIKELDGLNIVNAKYKNNILIVNYKNNFNYTNMIIKINKSLDKYKIIYKEENDVSNINFTVNDKGVACFIPEDDKMLLLFNYFENDNIREIKDKNIKTNMNLYSYFSNINMFINNEIYQISLK